MDGSNAEQALGVGFVGFGVWFGPLDPRNFSCLLDRVTCSLHFLQGLMVILTFTRDICYLHSLMVSHTLTLKKKEQHVMRAPMAPLGPLYESVALTCGVDAELGPPASRGPYYQVGAIMIIQPQ